jgi:hypothetical protein
LRNDLYQRDPSVDVDVHLLSDVEQLLFVKLKTKVTRVEHLHELLQLKIAEVRFDISISIEQVFGNS